MNVNFFDPAVNADPFPVLEEVRAAGRAVYNPVHDEWMVTGYDDIMALFTKHQQATLENQRADAARMFGGEMLEVQEGQHHHELRNVWAKDFSASAIEEQRAQIERIIDQAFDAVMPKLAEGRTIEVVGELTRSIPARVIAGMLGIAPEMRADVIRWSDDMADSLSAMLDASEKGEAMREASRIGTENLRGHIASLIVERRSRPGDDPISKLVHSSVGQRIDDNEVLANCTFLTFAGNETTAKLIASCVAMLARHPDQRAKVAADRSLVAATVEEVLRFSSVAQMVPRMVITGPLDVAGKTFEIGDKLMLLLGAANRDPERWDEPDRFDVTRKPRRHMGFGFGPHLCLGLNLARLEAQIFVDRLLDRLPSYQVDAVDYGANFMLRGPQQLELVRS